jgi:glutathione S-transferase
MFELQNITRLAETEGVDILAKVVFSFSPDIIMSPLALPKELLHPWIDELLASNLNPALNQILVQLRTRQTFQEQWPNEWESALDKGKQRVLQLEHIRGDDFTLADILSTRPEVYEWYQSI